VIVGAFVVAAIVTPPDVISQLLLAIPMCLLYEIGILLAQLIERFARKRTAEDEVAPVPGEPGAEKATERLSPVETEQKLPE